MSRGSPSTGPQARNALTFAMYQGLAEICGRIEKTREAKALVITGAGDKAFAAGTDIAQFKDFKERRGRHRLRAQDGRARSRSSSAAPCRPSRRSSGFCTGGGIADRRRLRLPARRGQRAVRRADRAHAGQLPVDGQLRAAGALVGPQTVKEMLLLARMVDAPKALQAGLVMEVLPDTAALHARAQELAETLAGHAPITMSDHQGGDAPPAGEDRRREYRRPDPPHLRQRRLPRRHDSLPGEAPAEMDGALGWSVPLQRL